MTIDELLALKTRWLQNPDDREAQRLIDEALAQMSSDQRLEAESELQFMTDFWQQTSAERPVQPSGQLRSNFYQMLAQQKQDQRTGPLTLVKQWFIERSNAMQPAFQFALVCIVFMAGMGTQSLVNSNDNNAVNALESRVEELNVMVALSLLQKPSASERLSGVAYSSRSGQITDALVSELLKLLESDKSTAVRLAIIEALSDYAMIGSIEEQILDALLKQENVLVQIQLVELLKRHASKNTIDRLVALLDDDRIHDEVRDAFLNQAGTNNI